MTQFRRGSGYCQDPLSDAPRAPGSQNFIVLDTIEDLRAYGFPRSSFPEGQLVYVKGYHEVGDGGGGFFNYHRSGTVTDNGGTLIIPDNQFGYYGRVLNGEELTVMMFGAHSDGLESSIEAAQAAVDWLGDEGGGVLVFTEGIYKLDDRLLVDHNSICLKIRANTTLRVSGWSYPGGQTPFGNQIHITGNNCSVIGDGSSSLIQLVAGSDANGIGVLHKSGLLVMGVALDGGKEGVTAIADDTFQSGISLINDTTQNPGGEPGNFKIVACSIRNWAQYGVNIYGNLSTGAVENCDIHDNGISGQSLSVGAGIVMTSGVSHLRIYGCNIYENKFHGIFQSSAGQTSLNFDIGLCSVHDNGGSGLSFTEELQYSSISGIGTDGVTVANCVFSSNTLSGVVFGTYDNVGFLRNVTLEGNICRGNGAYGCLVQTSNHVTNRTSYVQGTGNTFQSNVDDGLGFGANLNATINFSENIVIGNGGSQIENGSAGLIALGFNSLSTTVPVNVAGDYTPAWTGSVGNPALGNGTLAGHYVKVDKQVTVNARLVIGGTTTFGSGTWSISLPFAISASARAVGACLLLDSGTVLVAAVAIGAAGATTVNFNPTGASAAVSSTVPFTWAVGDTLEFSVSYATD